MKPLKTKIINCPFCNKQIKIDVVRKTKNRMLEGGLFDVILYSDEEIKQLLIEEYPQKKDYIESNFDMIKKEMKQHSYLIEKIKDTVTDVGLEIIMGIK